MFFIVASESARARTMPCKSPLRSVNPGTLHRYVRSGAHRDADIGSRQRRCIVDPVAGHRDDPAFFSKSFDHAAFAFRENFGFDFGYAELRCNGVCGRAVVAGDHRHADARLTQSLKRRCCGWFHRIGDSQNTNWHSVDCNEDRRCAACPELFCLVVERLNFSLLRRS